MVSCEMFVSLPKSDSGIKREFLLHSCACRQVNSRSRVQVNPSQKDKYDLVPSVDFPAAKILLEFPSLTSRAVTGPGRSPSLPNFVQVLFPNENKATLTEELSENEKAPEATSESWLSWRKPRSVIEGDHVTA